VAILSTRISTFRLIYALAGTVLLLAAWESFAAHSFSGTTGLVRHGPVLQDASGTDELDRALAALPSPQAPRVVLLGSSQIDVVKDGAGEDKAIPFRLSAALQAAGVGHEILDLSAGGQQILESLVILVGSAARTRPRAVVIAAGLFSMLRADVRESLPAAVDMAAVRAAVADPSLLPDPDARKDLLGALPAPGTAGDRTVQDRIDARLSTFLAARLVMVDRRRVMFKALLDNPIRRDLVALVQRHSEGSRTARTFEIGGPYALGLASLEVMARWSARRHLPCVLVVMPFESTREPLLYSPSTQRRVAGDLRALAARTGASFLDLGGALQPSDYGTFVDGSPDNLHFGARGHDVVGRAVADVLGPLLGSGPRVP
jgi:hypothetical protein